jgi:hypothetical protein
MLYQNNLIFLLFVNSEWVKVWIILTFDDKNLLLILSQPILELSYVNKLRCLSKTASKSFF